MKLMDRRVSMITLIVLLLYVAPAVAVDDPPYTLGRIGALSVSDKNANEQQTMGVVVGLRLNYSFYVEGELNVYVAGGDYVGKVEQGRMKISTLGLYGAYRYMLSPSYYFKAKAGLIYEDIKRVDNNTQKEFLSNGSSGSGGIGLGVVYQLNNKPVMIEFEATIIEQNILLYTVGMTAPF